MAKAWSPSLRLHLTGRISIETGGRLLDERALPGRQGRQALVYLALERARSVPHDELADRLWGETAPSAWEAALAAVVSKLRGLLSGLGLGRSAITSTSGCYQLRLPADAWVDVEAATQGLDEAEGALRGGNPRAAWGPANVAASIARRPFLSGADTEWIVRQRETLRAILGRALDCLGDVALVNHEYPLAAQLADEIVRLEPFRESGYRRLMRARAATGDRAEALRVYDECRRFLEKELGVAPSSETETLRRALLSST